MPSLTPRIVAVTARFEGVVLESYLDTSVPPVWTWSMGLTAAAGVNVKDYVNRPASLATCLQAAVKAINTKYWPAVLHAFSGQTLNDAQWAAALSFHWQTGAIGYANWVDSFRRGAVSQSLHDLTNNYLGGGAFQDRRDAEAALFFKNTWPADMRAPIYQQVTKPKYRPTSMVKMDLIPVLQQIMGGN